MVVRPYPSSAFSAAERGSRLAENPRTPKVNSKGGPKLSGIVYAAIWLRFGKINGEKIEGNKEAV
jgi:hypothetical protein